MAELKAKVTLKAKGDEAFVSVKQLMVALKWRAAVDLDLMAFYKAKDGRVGGVFSDNYAGGSMGNLNAFPFIQLSGDEGVGAAGGDNEEVLRIAQLGDLAEIYICALNFTDASQDRRASFARYDGHVIVTDDKGETIGVPLDSNEPGAVAVICKIDNTNFMGAKLINENRVIGMAEFISAIPGAATLDLASKVVLRGQGEAIRLKPKSGAGVGEIVVNLNWSQGASQPQGFLQRLAKSAGSGIDLDLGCLYELSNGDKSAIQALGDSFGNFDRPPHIMHCGDDRTGGWSEGENLRINGADIARFRRILIYAFIYEGVARWSQADGVVTVKRTGSPDIVVELNEHRDGQNMCAIALFENQGGQFQVRRVVQYFGGHEPMDKAFNWGLKWVPGVKPKN